jgi:hypothetical protein
MDILKRRAGGTGSSFLDQVVNSPDWRTLDLGGGHAAAEFGALDTPEDDRIARGLGDLLPFNLIVFPSLGFVGSHLRLICPVGVDRTEVYLYPILPKSADEAKRTQLLRDHEAFYGPSGAGSTDDVEVGFERRETRGGRDTRRYRIGGRGLGGWSGVLWTDPRDGTLLEYELPIPDEPGFIDGRLRLVKTVELQPAQWETYKRSKVSR